MPTSQQTCSFHVRSMFVCSFACGALREGAPPQHVWRHAGAAATGLWRWLHEVAAPLAPPWRRAKATRGLSGPSPLGSWRCRIHDRPRGGCFGAMATTASARGYIYIYIYILYIYILYMYIIYIYIYYIYIIPSIIHATYLVVHKLYFLPPINGPSDERRPRLY